MSSEAAPARKRGRPRTTPEQLAQRRQLLIKAAFEVMVNKGYAATTVADIAAHAGLAFGSYYTVFEGKREILDEVLDYGLERILSEINPTLPAPPRTYADLEAQFTTVSNNITRAFTDLPGLARLLVLEAVTIDDAMTQRWLGLLDLGTTLIAGYLTSGVDTGILRPGLDVRETARAILGTILSAILSRVHDVSSDVTAYSNASIAMISNGIRA